MDDNSPMDSFENIIVLKNDEPSTLVSKHDHITISNAEAGAFA
jgi:hypothetical protein